MSRGQILSSAIASLVQGQENDEVKDRDGTVTMRASCGIFGLASSRCWDHDEGMIISFYET